MAKFDFNKGKNALSDEQLAQINGGVYVDFNKVGISGGMDVTPEYIDKLYKSGELSGLITTFNFAGSYYVQEIEDLYKEYEGSGYEIPGELDAVLRQFL